MMRPITDVAASVGLSPEELEPYGRFMAKLPLAALEGPRGCSEGKLVLVTGITPTPAGEGKTTVAIGLTDALNRAGTRAVAAIREPSMGPVFGMKGGGTGGGRARLLPSEEINLHFTGDLHAVAAANNLLAAVVENHLHRAGDLRLDPHAVTWKRCLDVNDRALREIVVGLGGRGNGPPRETGFEVTAASEVMAVLSLASSLEDLRARLARIVVGADLDGKPVTAGDLHATGAMLALLRDAIKPNLVQTAEGAPALVHGGPFGNIAHGCSSVMATRLGVRLGDLCVTEAGFGADLGAEKFVDIKMRQSGLAPHAAVLVATVRALKMHGGVALEDLAVENVAAVEAGFPNLLRHVEILGRLGLSPVVAVNRFAGDTPPELNALLARCGRAGVPAAVADVWARGGEGAAELADLVLEAVRTPAQATMLYPKEAPLREKLETIAREAYGAGSVELLPAAAKGLDALERQGMGRLSVCIAKTQYSFTDDPAVRGAPAGHRITIRDVKLCAGAGFVVAYAGTIRTMPGLPQHPAAEALDVTPDGAIVGLS
jgi:formate--tetrahydrofolate ligase